MCVTVIYRVKLLEALCEHRHDWKTPSRWPSPPPNTEGDGKSDETPDRVPHQPPNQERILSDGSRAAECARVQ